jgi:hypothetical protein
MMILRVLPSFAAAMLLCLASFPGVSYAQDGSEQAIVFEYCEATQDLIDEANQELSRNGEDLAECFDDQDQCQRRADDAQDSVQCVSRFSRCANNSIRDLEQSCGSFLRGFRDEYKDAMRAADRNDVDDEVRTNPRFVACTGNALDTVALCGGIDVD